jgi:ESS family glutamate:Na+ symporter
VAASIALPMLPSLLAACLVLLVGGLLAQRMPLLARYSIPAPIVGGLIFAVLALVAERTIGFGIAFDTSAKTAFLLLFFASIGLTADLAVLRRGGARLMRFLLSLFPFLLAQDALGVVMARFLGLHPVLGLVAGSITLVAATAPARPMPNVSAEEHDILGVMGLTMTSATIGLILGGIIGGPVAERLIRRTALADATIPAADGGVVGGPVSTPVTTLSFISSLAAALAAIVAGQAIGSALEGGAITVPAFLWCLIVGLIIRNGAGAIGAHLHDAASELIGSVCLSLFLTWTMMTLHLGDAVQMAGPLLIILAAQTMLVAAWASWVTFPAVGRDYESAVISGAFCGFAMGATATAIANMQALTRRHGPAPQAFVVVPIVGAFFIDLMNLAVLTFFLLPGLVVGNR